MYHECKSLFIGIKAPFGSWNSNWNEKEGNEKGDGDKNKKEKIE